MIPGLLNLTSIYFICMDRARSSYFLCIFCICVAAERLPASSRASERLVWYSMFRASACFFANLLPDYSDWIPVFISVSLTLGVTCRN